MINLTRIRVGKIINTPRRQLVRWDRAHYHIVAVQMPPRVLCGRPFGARPQRLNWASHTETPRHKPWSTPTLCSLCWQRFNQESVPVE